MVSFYVSSYFQEEQKGSIDVFLYLEKRLVECILRFLFLHTFAETEKKHPKNLIAVFSEIPTIGSHIIDVHSFLYKNKI